jgi:hypothetical protein
MSSTKLNRIVIQHLDGARKGDLEAFSQSAVTIGRAQDCDLVFNNEKSTSSHHAVLRQRDGQVEVVDTQSTNGTYVNEARVERAVLKDGDVIRFGVLGPTVKIGLPEDRDDQTAMDLKALPQLAPVASAMPLDATEPFAATVVDALPRRNWRFARNAAVLYLGGAVAAVGVVNTLIDRYKLDLRWFSVFLVFLAGGFLITLLEAWYRGTPGTQKVAWWEVSFHAATVIGCLIAAYIIWT